ncbi:DUF1345 domain-containing protein [Arsenicicoccus piscis]|uniref:DUF1345 domain-containing protein n=1 Tax=Arsenicicoccus piscis TaxID=673954 RepID=A0ABQ6HTN4_9MICO|nr:DUF1345 domain-containing protein [Arsenicicoccus piscis]GMA21198.1 hypothetical protein GCM10025862_32190 [Arsenicicoccus piscis]
MSTLVKADAEVDSHTKLAFQHPRHRGHGLLLGDPADRFREPLRARPRPRGRPALPGHQHPRPVDFVYLAFTLGSSFATSDVEITSRRMRFRVLLHSVLSFFYNAAVVALAISVITGK